MDIILKGNNLYKDFIKYLKDNNIDNIFIVSFHFKEEPVVLKELRDSGIKYTIFNRYTPNPKYEEVLDGIEEYKKTNAKLILAIGGGSPMDVAKCIKAFSTMNTNDYLHEEIKENGITLAALPTTAGTGSERTRYAVIYKDGLKQSVHSDTIIPSIVLFDPSFLKDLSIYSKKCTMLDALSHSIESYWSVNSNDESKEYSKKSINLILDNIDKYLDEDETVYGNMLLASLYSGEAINITQTTAGHAMAYKLTSLYKVPHGLATMLVNAKLLPYMYENGNSKLKETIDELGIILRTDNIKEYLNNLLIKLDLYKDIPINYDDIDELVDNVNLDRLKNNPYKLSKEDIRNIYIDIFNEIKERSK